MYSWDFDSLRKMKNELISLKKLRRKELNKKALLRIDYSIDTYNFLLSFFDEFENEPDLEKDLDDKAFRARYFYHIHREINSKIVNSCVEAGRVFENIQYSYDVILSNPPYIPHSMVQKLLQDGRSEPVLALDGDITLFGERAKTEDGKEKDDGLEIIRNLIPQCKSHLSPMGIVLMETGEYNAEETSQIAKNYGFKTEIFTDLENQLRVVVME